MNQKLVHLLRRLDIRRVADGTHERAEIPDRFDLHNSILKRLDHMIGQEAETRVQHFGLLLAAFYEELGYFDVEQEQVIARLAALESLRQHFRARLVALECPIARFRLYPVDLTREQLGDQRFLQTLVVRVRHVRQERVDYKLTKIAALFLVAFVKVLCEPLHSFVQ